MKFVVSFLVVSMLMGIVGCATQTAQPESQAQAPKYTWDVKISRSFSMQKGSDVKKKLFFFYWTLNKVVGDKKEKITSERMIASYEHDAVFKRDNGKKSLEAVFSIETADNGADDVAICEFNITALRKGKRRYSETWEARRLIPANLKKSITLHLPEEPKKDDILDKID